jgi:hypothetical protein
MLIWWNEFASAEKFRLVHGGCFHPNIDRIPEKNHVQNPSGLTFRGLIPNFCSRLIIINEVRISQRRNHLFGDFSTGTLQHMGDHDTLKTFW